MQATICGPWRDVCPTCLAPLALLEAKGPRQPETCLEKVLKTSVLPRLLLGAFNKHIRLLLKPFRMDHASNHSSSTHATTNYQSVSCQEIQDHGEGESHQANLDPIKNEPGTSGNENGDPQGSEMPRMERHGLDLATILGDVAAVTSPIAFLVFAIMVLCLDGSETSETLYAKWNNATTIVGGLFNV